MTLCVCLPNMNCMQTGNYHKSTFVNLCQQNLMTFLLRPNWDWTVFSCPPFALLHQIVCCALPLWPWERPCHHHGLFIFVNGPYPTSNNGNLHVTIITMQHFPDEHITFFVRFEYCSSSYRLQKRKATTKKNWKICHQNVMLEMKWAPVRFGCAWIEHKSSRIPRAP